VCYSRRVGVGGFESPPGPPQNLLILKTFGGGEKMSETSISTTHHHFWVVVENPGTKEVVCLLCGEVLYFE